MNRLRGLEVFDLASVFRPYRIETYCRPWAMTDFLEHEQPFRPAKRRKLYRKRDDDDTTAGQSTLEVVDLSPNSQTIEELLSTEGGVQDPTDGAEASEVSVAAIIRQRKAAQRRRGGIEFTNSTTSTSRSLPAMHQLSKALVGKDDMLADIDAVVNRFAPQTGQVADVDRHMYVNPTLYLTHFLIQPLTC